MTTTSLGSVLVVGGCGFLGHQVVSMLMQEPNCTVSVLSRNPSHSRIIGVSYHACDVTDIKCLRPLLLELQPRVIINTASPMFYGDKVDVSLLYQVNVVGTQNLLEVAKTTKSVEAFVHTSTSSVHAGFEFRFITEEAPLLTKDSESSKYAITKALADMMVLKASCQELRTLCLRPPVIYGERDGQLIPGALAVLYDKKTNVQLGDNTNLFDAIYVGNAASAHILAARALLMNNASGLKVDGEAFFVTDDAPIPFWDFQRKIWAEAGDKTPLAKVHRVPAWVGMALASVMEYLFWFFTLGLKMPPKTLRRDVLRYVITNQTFNIDKAKERLGYKPLIDTDEGIKRAVDWALHGQAHQ